MVSNYRIDSVGNLARQMGFTPVETRLGQIEAAEALLHEIDPARAYPLNFIVYRITGYHPKTHGDSDLLTGLGLQHDLGQLIEQVSESLNLHAQTAGEPVLSIDDVTHRFNVTSKTIQRWRRRGLAARRFIFPDGKRRVGFLLGSVERFVVAHQDQLPGTTNLSLLLEPERQEILRRARRLVTVGGCWPDEIARRIGRRLCRSPMAILHTIRKHDGENPRDGIFSRAAEPPTEAERWRILRGYQRGLSLGKLARRCHRPQAAIARIILDHRISRLDKRKVKFIDDALYHGPDAQAMVAEIVSQPDLAPAARIEDSRIPRDLPPQLRELCREPLLTPARERALFLKLNFHKYQFVAARRRLEPLLAKSSDLTLLEDRLAQATAVRNEILRANFRLVISVARKHLRPGLTLGELISEGNVTLMRAVEGFDVHKGNRFSTYATLALMKGFARTVPMLLSQRSGSSDSAALANLADRGTPSALQRRIDEEHVRQLLLRLDDRERRVLQAHYGLGDSDRGPASYEQLGARLGLSRRRVRQIERSALIKLRRAAQS